MPGLETIRVSNAPRIPSSTAPSECQWLKVVRDVELRGSDDIQSIREIKVHRADDHVIGQAFIQTQPAQCSIGGCGKRVFRRGAVRVHNVHAVVRRAARRRPRGGHVGRGRARGRDVRDSCLRLRSVHDEAGGVIRGHARYRQAGSGLVRAADDGFAWGGFVPVTDAARAGLPDAATDARASVPRAGTAVNNSERCRGWDIGFVQAAKAEQHRQSQPPARNEGRRVRRTTDDLETIGGLQRARAADALSAGADRDRTEALGGDLAARVNGGNIWIAGSQCVGLARHHPTTAVFEAGVEGSLLTDFEAVCRGSSHGHGAGVAAAGSEGQSQGEGGEEVLDD
jgi:hypothetical protein